MKKVLMLLIALAMVFSMAGIVSADMTVSHDVEEVYEVDIPSDVALFVGSYTDAPEVKVGATGVKTATGNQLVVTIESTNGFHIVNQESNIIYTAVVKTSEGSYQKCEHGDVILKLDSGVTIGNATMKFNTTKAEIDKATRGGQHKDTLTFTFSFDKEGATKYAASKQDLLDFNDWYAENGASSGSMKIRLSSDINFEGDTWTPIYIKGYHGAEVLTIDGAGHTITNLPSPLVAGGFAGESGIIIKDLTIADSDIVGTGSQGTGAFIESADSMQTIVLENCHLVDSSVKGVGDTRTGGLIGWTAGYDNENDGPVKSYVTVTRCSVKNCEITGTGSVGGIIGHSGGNAWTYTTISNCEVSENTLTAIDDGSWRVGVVIGTVNVGEQNDITSITSSENHLYQYTDEGKTEAVTSPGSDNYRDYYGRFVPVGTGKLTIEGTPITA